MVKGEIYAELYNVQSWAHHSLHKIVQ
jgi:hypothetical protein